VEAQVSPSPSARIYFNKYSGFSPTP
jgi:hypothetical protein